MRAPEARRKLAILLDGRRELPRYVWRYAHYLGRSRRDSAWLEAPLVVPLSPSVEDLSLEVVPGDEIGRFLYLYGVWDLASTRLVQRFLGTGMTALDVGANIGYFSVLAGRRVGPRGLVHSFEPHDEIRRRLALNVARNGLSNVVVRAEAVTSTTGETRFYRSVESSNQGISSTVAGPAPHGGRRETSPFIVPSVRLDDVANELSSSIDLVKLDVEGAELAAFEGGASLLSAADAPLLLFEAYDLKPSAELLGRYGYKVRSLAHDLRRGVRLVSDSDAEGRGEPNYVAYKRRHEPALAALM
jgi:FkbM family methyltransferase